MKSTNSPDIAVKARLLAVTWLAPTEGGSTEGGSTEGGSTDGFFTDRLDMGTLGVSIFGSGYQLRP